MEFQHNTPYGATEALPVSSIGSDAILQETRVQTDAGQGVCVGLPVESIDVTIIAISDEPIAQWSDALALGRNQIGEIVVAGEVVSHAYYNREGSTELAKIADGDILRHRMGDVGYVDDFGRLWMCGRKAHRVQTKARTLFTIPVEAVFNTHPDVFRTALVGIRQQDDVRPVLCVELENGVARAERPRIERELGELGAVQAHTADIDTFLFRRSFPVDVRHNAKIFREQLAVWAKDKLP